MSFTVHRLSGSKLLSSGPLCSSLPLSLDVLSFFSMRGPRFAPLIRLFPWGLEESCQSLRLLLPLSQGVGKWRVVGLSLVSAPLLLPEALLVFSVESNRGKGPFSGLAAQPRDSDGIAVVHVKKQIG